MGLNIANGIDCDVQGSDGYSYGDYIKSYKLSDEDVERNYRMDNRLDAATFAHVLYADEPEKISTQAKSVVAQDRQRRVKASVNVLRMAKMAMCSHLFDTVIARARAITPKVRQHGAVIRSTAKSGDSNNDDGGDPDPADTFIIDHWSFINKNKQSKPENRILRKAILYVRHKDTTNCPLRVSNWYVKNALRYIQKATYTALSKMTYRGHPVYDDVPAVAIRILYKLAESHDLNRIPNPVAKTILYGMSCRDTYSMRKAARGGIFTIEREKADGDDQSFADIFDLLYMSSPVKKKASSSAEATKPEKGKKASEAESLDTVAEDVSPKKKPKAKSKAESTTDKPAASSDEIVTPEEPLVKTMCLSSDAEYCLPPSGEFYQGVKIDHLPPAPVKVAAYQSKGVIRHSFDAPDADNETPIDALLYREGAFFHADEMETDTYSGEDADAVEAGNIARQLVQQVNNKNVSVDDVAKVILSQGEKGERVILALQKDLQNTDTCNQILMACGAELQSAPIDVAEAVVDIDDALQQVSDLGVDDLLMKNAPECLFHMKRLCGYCLNGQENGSNFMTKLKNRAENKRKLFDPRISEVAGILLAGSKASTRKGGAA